MLWVGCEKSHSIKIEMIWLNYLFQKLGWQGFCCQVFCDWTRLVTWPCFRAVVGCWLADNVFLVVESKQCFARAQVQDIHFLRVWLTSSEYSATPLQHYGSLVDQRSPPKNNIFPPPLHYWYQLLKQFWTNWQNWPIIFCFDSYPFLFFWSITVNHLHLYLFLVKFGESDYLCII